MSSTQKETDIAVAEKEELKEPSSYNVVVHDNDRTSYEEVIWILSKTFDMTPDEALYIAQKVDVVGRGICGTYSKEIAESKLFLAEIIKDSLISAMPQRAIEIKMLKFTMEKA